MSRTAPGEIVTCCLTVFRLKVSCRWIHVFFLVFVGISEIMGRSTSGYSILSIFECGISVMNAKVLVCANVLHDVLYIYLDLPLGYLLSSSILLAEYFLLPGLSESSSGLTAAVLLLLFKNLLVYPPYFGCSSSCVTLLRLRYLDPAGSSFSWPYLGRLGSSSFTPYLFLVVGSSFSNLLYGDL